MLIRFSQFGGEERDWPVQSSDLNPIQHLWDGLDRRLWARSDRPTSVLHLTDALVSEWEQIPAARFNIWRKDWNLKSGRCHSRLTPMVLNRYVKQCFAIHFCHAVCQILSFIIIVQNNKLSCISCTSIRIYFIYSYLNVWCWSSSINETTSGRICFTLQPLFLPKLTVF